MKKALGRMIAAALLSTVVVPAQAITINIDPLAQNSTVGSSIDVALEISGLTDGGAPSLGSYDLDVGFDSSILAFETVTFGDPALGDQLDVLGLGNIAVATPGLGTVNMFELSFDLPSDLDSMQAGSFTLALMTFKAVSVGTSSWAISINTLGDALGDPLLATVRGGSITSTSVVPEPSTLLLLTTCLSTMVFLMRSRRPRKIENVHGHDADCI